jgi:hypothetical protein
VALAITCATILIAGAIATDSHHGPDSVSISSDGAAFWLNVDPGNVFVDVVRGPQGERALKVQLHGDRHYFTIFQHRFKKMANLSGRPYLLVNFRGTGSDRTYSFFVDFKSDASSSAMYQIRDYRPGWRQVYLNAEGPQAHKGQLDWSQVSGFRLASNDNKAAEFSIGAIRAANRTSSAN